MSDRDVICEAKNRCGLITLNRPKVLNALTYDMIAEMERNYIAWAQDPHIYGVVVQSSDSRAFCSGGDLKVMYEWKQSGKLDTLLALYGQEYQHNWSLQRFVKPNVSLLDGVVMGGGVGICIYGTHKVASPTMRFAMPEVGIGYFPDCGASWFLSRLPGEVGTYLALTGRALGPADAFALGLVTHCIGRERYDEIRRAMSEAEPVDTMLDAMHEEPAEGELAPLRPAIERIFSGGSVDEILDRLDSEKGEHAKWARDTAAEIRTKSPTGLKVALRQMRIGPGLGLDQALVIENRLAYRFIRGNEFFEGIRAAVIDKDRAPKWSPASLAEVSEAMVDAFFEPLKSGELVLVDPFPDAAKGIME